MYIPMLPLIILCLLAAIPVLVLIAAFHCEMKSRGLCFLGVAEEYHENSVRIERWCLFYIPIVTRKGWHSTSLP